MVGVGFAQFLGEQEAHCLCVKLSDKVRRNVQQLNGGSGFHFWNVQTTSIAAGASDVT